PPTTQMGQAALLSNISHIPANLRLYVPDPDGAESYPIVSLSWLLLYERYQDHEKSAALRRFVPWALSSVQPSATELGYIPLPAEITSLSRAALERIQKLRRC